MILSPASGPPDLGDGDSLGEFLREPEEVLAGNGGSFPEVVASLPLRGASLTYWAYGVG